MSGKTITIAIFVLTISICAKFAIGASTDVVSAAMNDKAAALELIMADN